MPSVTTQIANCAAIGEDGWTGNRRSQNSGCSQLNEREQISIDLICMRGQHAVGKTWVSLQDRFKAPCLSLILSVGDKGKRPVQLLHGVGTTQQPAHKKREENCEHGQQIKSHANAQSVRPSEATCETPNHKQSHDARDDPDHGSHRGQQEAAILDARLSAVIPVSAHVPIESMSIFIEVVQQPAQGDRGKPAVQRDIRQPRCWKGKLAIGF
jgi:hypothetical protein